MKTKKAKENFADNGGQNILRTFLLYQFLIRPQVKRRVIISNKHGIYELPHDLPNDLKLRILEY